MCMNIYVLDTQLLGTLLICHKYILELGMHGDSHTFGLSVLICPERGDPHKKRVH